MRAHRFLNCIFLVIREKDELYLLSLESVTSIIKLINLLKVVYHPVSCLLHHYIVLYPNANMAIIISSCCCYYY